MIKIVPLAAGLVSANAVSSALFGMGIRPFLLDGWLGAKKSSASDSSWEISLSEFFMKNLGMDTRIYASGDTAFGNLKNPLLSAFSMNLRSNGAASAVALVGAAVVPKLLRKTGILRQGNSLLKQVGMGGIVQF